METKDVLISVVVPVYNRAGVVAGTLDSIAAQTYQSFELIIVDNASTDGSKAVVEGWAEAHRQVLPSVVTGSCATPGAAAARNAGLALVRGRWTMFFDSDDIMLPWHLAAVAEAIEANPEADIIGWDVEMRRRDGSSHAGRFYGRSMQRHNLFNGAMATQRWAARTALIRSAGAWDENVGYWDDIELGSRLLAAAKAPVYIGKGGVEVRESTDSISAAGARNPSAVEPSLLRMEKTLGSRGRRWCRLKRVVEYALSSRSGSTEGMRCMKALRPSPFLWAAYYYTRFGGRGVSRLMFF